MGVGVGSLDQGGRGGLAVALRGGRTMVGGKVESPLRAGCEDVRGLDWRFNGFFNMRNLPSRYVLMISIT